jgi:hypothetical protein
MNNKKLIVPIFALIAILVIGGIVLGVGSYFNEHSYTITVTDKDRVYDKDSSKYLVFGENTETGETKVFENTDSLIKGKFNSSDFYGNLKVGETYKITVYGYRFPLFSWYENIIKYEKVDTK